MVPQEVSVAKSGKMCDTLISLDKIVGLETSVFFFKMDPTLA